MRKIMVELNRELILDELSNFEKKKNGSDIPDILNKYLEAVAQNGDPIFAWNKLQPLLRRKLEAVMCEFNDKCPTYDLPPLPNVKPFDFDELKCQILEAIDSFPSAPFTIQRLCELVVNPNKHYKRTDKFMRGIEKNILVVSTVEPKSLLCDELTYTATSSFKGLFSALHSIPSLTQSSSSSSSSSLSPPLTSSLILNGASDESYETQICAQSTHKDDNTSETSQQQKCNINSSPVSPTSLPLSPTTNSPPSSHLAPLQQLDSFTTVFAATPSTPLSVVSDLQNYEHDSTLRLESSTLSKEKSTFSSSTNDSEDKQVDSNDTKHIKIESNDSEDKQIESNDSKDMLKIEANDSETKQIESNESEDTKILPINSEDKQIEFSDSENKKIESIDCEDKQMEFNDSENKQMEFNDSEDIIMESNDSDDIIMETNESENKPIEFNDSEDKQMESNMEVTNSTTSLELSEISHF